MLGESNRGGHIAHFTALNWSPNLFTDALIHERVDATHLRYLEYYHDTLKKANAVVTVLIVNLHRFDPNKMFKYLDESYYAENGVIERTLRQYLFTDGGSIFNDNKWDEYQARCVMEFIMWKFPHFIGQYLDEIIGENFEFDPYGLRLVNESLKCLELLLEMSAGTYDAEWLPNFYRYIWRYRMCDVCFEFRDELFGVIKNRTPVMKLVRRRTNTKMDVYRRYLSVKWDYLCSIGRKPFMGVPPRLSLYSTLHIDEHTDDEELDDSDW
jgi:hypothetical protein